MPNSDRSGWADCIWDCQYHSELQQHNVYGGADDVRDRCTGGRPCGTGAFGVQSCCYGRGMYSAIV